MKTRLAALTVLAAALCGCGKMADNAAAARQSAESFLAAMCAGEAGDAYDGMVTAAYQQSATRERHVKLSNLLAKRLGAIRSARCTSWFVQSGTSGTLATLQYQVVWANGSGTASFRMRQAGGQWLVEAFNVNSDTLLGLDADAEPSPPASAPAPGKSP